MKGSHELLAPLHDILQLVREMCEREPCGDVWQDVGDIQRGESHLPPTGARPCCRPEDVIACCAFGLSDASLRRQACEKNTTRVLQTIAEWGRQMATSLVSSRNILGGLEFWHCALVTGLEVLRF